MERTPGRVLVIVPTYNERENLPLITRRLREALPDVHLLVADDNSPDGTGRIADELAEADDHVHVLHRTSKQGLGAAYIAGFRWGLAEGYDVLVEMDADGSHQPEELHKLLDAVTDGADLSIGSRWVPGGRTVNWPFSRELLSRGANTYVRLVLGIPVRDATAGFRAYRAATLEKIGLDDVESQGYCFQVDLTLRTVRQGLRVTEIPITFVERTVGSSKMSRKIIFEAFWRIAVWGVTGFGDRFRPRR
ncbi:MULTISPECIES: polyprenol monophosphomannose synthase [Microbispora]|uniref:Dolichol-phosphate mannosyltransferase n=1 Tax=Microbispora siamensis TaxID=564413 RepID=A0ABQ4H163_9ACTN|nr:MULTISPECIES: polyprenol monophosphomannose synthase [Microbispora]OPG01918.1 dolichol-phosphate mannosyltransferase [Microbispora sp. GKU 823]GIH67274.1 dolichol-phosphate mannosyltransferase [Microbispora siamensis]